jgi:hypothetical protein
MTFKFVEKENEQNIIKLIYFTSNTFTSYCLHSIVKTKWTLKVTTIYRPKPFYKKKPFSSFIPKYKNILPRAFLPSLLEHTQGMNFSLHHTSPTFYKLQEYNERMREWENPHGIHKLQKKLHPLLIFFILSKSPLLIPR